MAKRGRPLKRFPVLVTTGFEPGTWYTVSAASQALGIPRRTIYDRIAKKTAISRNFGNLVYVDLESLKGA